MVGSPGRKPVVLLVEDDEDVRDVVGGLLADVVYEVLAASDGSAALELLEAGASPDVILLDLAMPRMNGWQLWQALQASAALQHIPVVFFTASEPGPELKGQRVVVKGASAQTIIAALEDARGAPRSEPHREQRSASRTEGEAPARAPRGNTAGQPRPLVLVVDDDDDIRGSLERLLMDDYDVRVAKHGGEAIVALETGPRPVIIILDLRMPVVDGFAFLDWLRTSAHHDVNVLIFSSTIPAHAGALPERVEKGADVSDIIAAIARATAAA